VMVSGAVWSGRDDLWSPRYYQATVVVGLTLDRQELHRRIDARAALIFDGGAVEEVRRFREQRGLALTSAGGAGIRSAIGYPEICAYLAGEAKRDEAVERIAAATRQYARRQLTWLRKLEGTVMIDVGGRDAGAVARQIREFRTNGVQIKETHPA